MSDVQDLQVTDWRPAPPALQSTPATLVSLAIQQGANIETLERLYKLQLEYEANDARKQFARAMAAFKAESITISKDKAVSHKGGSYKHATLGNVVGVIAEALGRHGLYHAWSTSQDNGVISVTCVLTHEAGHRASITMSAMPDDSGSKNAIQQFGSTVTYLQRYTLMAITGTAATDQDDDGAGSPGRDPRVNQFLAAITAASTPDELRKVKVNITGAGLQGDDLQACTTAYNERNAELARVV